MSAIRNKSKTVRKHRIEDDIIEIISEPSKYGNSISIEKLVETLQILKDYYYNTETPLVSDFVFDILEDILRERDPDNIYLSVIGAPISKDKVKLPFHMPSLDKRKTNKEIMEFGNKKKGPYTWSLKLDGVSGLLYKLDGKFRLFTRGDGTYGQDITHLIKFVLENKFEPSKIPDNTAIRGELIISENNFGKIKDKFKNKRNAVAGLVNSKTIDTDVAKLTDFIGYNILNKKYKHEVQLKKLKEWGFPVVEHGTMTSLTEKYLEKLLKDKRTSSEYEIDGIVVTDNSQAYEPTKENPDYVFAYKTVLSDQVANVEVIDVMWNVTMHGYLKPILKLKPVTLVGVEITNVTAFNGKYVVDNKLGPGSVIKLVRSGDVIPHILEVIKPSKDGEPKMPTIPYKWNDTGIDLIVKDIHGSAEDSIIIKQLTHFFGTLNVKYISEGIIAKFVEHGYKTVSDILNANISELSKIDGIGEKLLSKIFDNTRIAFETTNLETLMASSNLFGRGLGVKKLHIIVTAYPNIMNEQLSADEIYNKVLVLNGFDVKTAKQFSINFEKFKKFFSTLEKIKLISVGHLKVPPKVKIDKTSKNIFANQKIVLTGTRDKAVENFIIDNGGQMSSSVSKNTNLLIYKDGETSSAKYIKAQELHVKTISLSEFKKLYKL